MLEGLPDFVCCPQLKEGWVWESEVQRANRIYCVVRPERNAVKRECNMALAYFSRNFYS